MEVNYFFKFIILIIIWAIKIILKPRLYIFLSPPSYRVYSFNHHKLLRPKLPHNTTLYNVYLFYNCLVTVGFKTTKLFNYQTNQILNNQITSSIIQQTTKLLENYIISLLTSRNSKYQSLSNKQLKYQSITKKQLSKLPIH